MKNILTRVICIGVSALSILFHDSVYGVFSYAPNLGVSSFGNKIAVWESIDEVDDHHYIEVVTMPLGSTWSAPLTVSAVGQYATHPRIAVDRSGNAIVVWVAYDELSGNNVLFGTVYSVNNTWSTPAQISGSNHDVLTDYDLEINQTTNEVSVMWSAYGAGSAIRGIYAASLTLGGVWSAPVKLSGP